MRIEFAKLDEMFKRSGVDKFRLHQALRLMGPENLKSKRMREMWSEAWPTTNYCYVVCEFVYWYVFKLHRQYWNICTLRVRSTPGIVHWFLRNKLDNSIVDLTADQFVNYKNDIHYEEAKKSFFLQSGCKGPSKRAKVLAKLMGYSEEDYVHEYTTLI